MKKIVCMLLVLSILSTIFSACNNEPSATPDVPEEPEVVDPIDPIEPDEPEIIEPVDPNIITLRESPSDNSWATQTEKLRKAN
ncbi:MAG: hypothetical protein IJE40_05655 [Clostridia bacterium]|nr:hypothetical protein [Clostridia bacterium]